LGAATAQEFPMTRFLISFVTAVALATLASLVTVQADAQVKIDKKPLGDLTTPVKGPNAGDSTTLPKNSKDLLGGLVIKRFDAGRDGPKINIIGVVGNIVSWDLHFNYKLSTWNGKTWTLVAEGGTRLIRAKESMNVQEKIPTTNDALKLKLEISAAKTSGTSKEFKLAAKKTVFTAHYGTTKSRWVVTLDYREDSNPNKLIGEAARKRAAELNALGLETQIHITQTTNLFGPDSNRIILYFRTQKEQTRTFDTEDAAKAFLHSLHKLAVDRENGRQAMGIELSITED
jgi:hypothetical protein